MSHVCWLGCIICRTLSGVADVTDVKDISGVAGVRDVTDVTRGTVRHGLWFGSYDYHTAESEDTRILVCVGRCNDLPISQAQKNVRPQCNAIFMATVHSSTIGLKKKMKKIKRSAKSRFSL